MNFLFSFYLYYYYFLIIKRDDRTLFLNGQFVVIVRVPRIIVMRFKTCRTPDCGLITFDVPRVNA